MELNYDFSGYVTKYNIFCADGRTIAPVMPVRFLQFCIETSVDAYPTGTLEFTALGDPIIEDTKISGSEY